MVAKRALNFGTPSRKRTKAQPYVLYRGLNPEMKYHDQIIPYSAKTTVTLNLCDVAQGTDVDERIGAKIKVWRIEYFLAQVSGDPIRVDLLISNIAGHVFAHGYDGSIDRQRCSHLKTSVLHSGSSLNSRGALVHHKLPYGVVVKYSGILGSTVNANQLIAQVTTPTATTITGYFRIWYTDS